MHKLPYTSFFHFDALLMSTTTITQKSHNILMIQWYHEKLQLILDWQKWMEQRKMKWNETYLLSIGIYSISISLHPIPLFIGQYGRHGIKSIYYLLISLCSICIEFRTQFMKATNFHMFGKSYHTNQAHCSLSRRACTSSQLLNIHVLMPYHFIHFPNKLR